MSERPIGLFQAAGLELEYMIVDRDTLAVRPIADVLLAKAAGEGASEAIDGDLGWSNELALHVIEIKTLPPAPSLAPLAGAFQSQVERINSFLAPENAMLLGGGAHPTMDPMTETKLWPHGQNEIYESYHRIFDCRGHGWVNLQSTHLNLPFADDEEFGRLHAAIRVLMPLLPALSASTPVLSGAFTGLMDSRLKFYHENQKKVPMVSGKVIPEAVFSMAEYHDRILARIYAAIAHLDPEGILQDEWLNSRGAIARFDRSAIEIRVLDIQECPEADLAIASLIIATLKSLCEERWSSYEMQKSWSEDRLADIFQKTIKDADTAIIEDRHYLALFGMPPNGTTAGAIWKGLRMSLQKRGLLGQDFKAHLDNILDNGSLSRRLLRDLGGEVTADGISRTWRRLSHCLAEGKPFTSAAQ